MIDKLVFALRRNLPRHSQYIPQGMIFNLFERIKSFEVWLKVPEFFLQKKR